MYAPAVSTFGEEPLYGDLDDNDLFDGDGLGPELDFSEDDDLGPGADWEDGIRHWGSGPESPLREPGNPGDSGSASGPGQAPDGLGRPHQPGPSGKYVVEGRNGRAGGDAVQSARGRKLTDEERFALVALADRKTKDEDLVGQLSEALSEDFHSALFSCYLKEARHTTDGYMQVVFRIPPTEVPEAIKLIKGYHKLLTCQISRRSTQ